MNLTKNNLLFSIAILFAFWFMAGGIFWVYWFAPIFAYPLGVFSLILWFYIKKDGRKRNKVILIILISGLLLSLAMLLPWFINQ